MTRLPAALNVSMRESITNAGVAAEPNQRTAVGIQVVIGTTPLYTVLEPDSWSTNVGSGPAYWVAVLAVTVMVVVEIFVVTVVVAGFAVIVAAEAD